MPVEQEDAVVPEFNPVDSREAGTCNWCAFVGIPPSLTRSPCCPSAYRVRPTLPLSLPFPTRSRCPLARLSPELAPKACCGRGAVVLKRHTCCCKIGWLSELGASTMEMVLKDREAVTSFLKHPNYTDDNGDPENRGDLEISMVRTNTFAGADQHTRLLPNQTLSLPWFCLRSGHCFC